MFRFFKLILLLIIFVLSACQKTDLSGHWHLLGDSSEIVQTWDINVDSLIVNKYEAYYGPMNGEINVDKEKFVGGIGEWQYNYHYKLHNDTLFYQKIVF